MKIDEINFPKLDSAVSLGPQLHTVLRKLIVTNVMQPGGSISVVDLAKELSISRQPIRDALIKLAEEGLVEIRPQRGTVVRKIDYNAVLDARFIREAIESDIVKIVANERTKDMVADLRTQIKEQRTAGQESPAKFTLLDEHFHKTLAVYAGKASAWSFVEGLRSQLDRVRYLSLSHFPVNKLIDQHTKIVDQIEAGSVSGSEDAMRTHLREILLDLPTILKTAPDFFEKPASRGPTTT